MSTPALPPLTPGFSHIAAALDGPRMMRHLEVFDRWPKHSGTPEELESLKYVRQEMEAYGYTTTLILHDAYISLPGAASAVVDGKPSKCITHSFSLASPAGGLTAPLVHVGP